MDYLMGIDLGSTSLKAIVYDLDGNAVAAGSRPTERFHPNPDHPEWTVWQPEQIWGGTAAGDPGGRGAAGRPRSRSERSPSPAWAWMACRSTSTAVGSIR